MLLAYWSKLLFSAAYLGNWRLHEDRRPSFLDKRISTRRFRARRFYWNVIRLVRLKVDVFSLSGWFVGFALF